MNFLRNNYKYIGLGVAASIPVAGLYHKNKPKKRSKKILFVYAAKDYDDLTKRDKLRDSDIKKIESTIKEFKNIEKYCYVADEEDIKENDYNLNVSRYVDISEEEEEINMQKIYSELIELKSKNEQLWNDTKKNLKSFGVKI